MMVREVKLVGAGLITLLHVCFLSFCDASENQPCRLSSCGDIQTSPTLTCPSNLLWDRSATSPFGPLGHTVECSLPDGLPTQTAMREWRTTGRPWRGGPIELLSVPFVSILYALFLDTFPCFWCLSVMTLLDINIKDCSNLISMKTSNKSHICHEKDLKGDDQFWHWLSSKNFIEPPIRVGSQLLLALVNKSEVVGHTWEQTHSVG
ncbi:hypothetical protein AAG906_031230 [Vitis piasezkii]